MRAIFNHRLMFKQSYLGHYTPTEYRAINNKPCFVGFSEKQ